MSRPIQLHADLAIDPGREAEAVRYFETVPANCEPVRGLHRPPAAEAAGGAGGLGSRRHQLPVLDHVHERRPAAEVGRVDAHQDVWGTLETFLTKRDYDFCCSRSYRPSFDTMTVAPASALIERPRRAC